MIHIAHLHIIDTEFELRERMLSYHACTLLLYQSSIFPCIVEITARVVVSLASLVPSHLNKLRDVFVATHHRSHLTMRPSRYARFSAPTLTANKTRIVSHAVRASDKDSQKSQSKKAAR
jgi:hypothetical protein